MSSSPAFQDQNSIERIREKLWCGQEFGQVALMIGSGFSRNAENISQDTPPFPLWKDLCYTILRATYPQGSSSKADYDIKIKQLLEEKEATTIAQEFLDLFGRSALDELLIRTIPDSQYAPSNLHTLMLTLPWSDVFTTNYDTLLERTLPTVYERKYDVVATVYDIPQKMKPRIVKLHGSFPSHRPFIISKSDYANYPDNFAPFTNIVVQSIMENTFCLIGFSSEDPNFNQWTKWVHKNLGKYKPYIYICGVLDLTEEQRSELVGNRISPIDLGPLFPKSDWIDPDLRHKNALEWFALNLMHGAPSNPMWWPEPSEKTHWKASNQLIPEIPTGPPRVPDLGSISPFKQSDNLTFDELNEICHKWKNQRDYYPGWIIAPYNNRKKLIEYTLEWIHPILEILKTVPAPDNIKILYELNWRIETCLLPVFSNWAEVYEQIILSYNPYPNLVQNEKSSYSPDKEECKKYDWNTIGKYWVHLIFQLIREDRWDQKHDKFHFWMNLIEQVVKLDAHWYLKWYYERCLYSLSKFDQNNLRILLKNWPKNQSFPLFEVKRAALLTELGELNKAKEITEKALNDIRSKLHTNPNNYLFLSQEGWTMLLLQSIQSDELFQSQKFEESFSVRNQFRDRWDRLTKYNCNPWQEIEKLQFILKNKPPSELPECTTNMGFDPGKTTKTYHLASQSTFIQKAPAFAFARIFEDVGLPVNCGCTSMFHEELLSASKWIEPNSPPWATSIMIRTGKEKEVGELFSRTRIVSMTDDQINNHFDLFISSLKQSLRYLDNCDEENGKEESFSNLQVKITTELLSRLAFRLSQKQIDELLNITNQLYIWNINNHHIEFDDPLNHLYERIFYSMSDFEIVENLQNLLDLPIIIYSEGQHPIMDRLEDPFSFIEWNKNTIIPEELRLSLTQDIIQLLEIVENGSTSERVRAIQRLTKLHQIQGLSSNEEEKFGRALWSRCDATTGFPADTDLLKASFLYLPEGESGVAREKMISYLSSTDIPKIFTSPISADGKAPTSSSTLGVSSFINYVREWTVATTSLDQNEGENIEKSIDWTADDAFSLLLKIKKTWDEDKATIIKYKNNAGSFDFFTSNADHEIWGILELLRVVILQRISKIENPEAKQIIKNLFDEMESNNIYTNSLIALQIYIEPTKYDELSTKLRKGLISSTNDEIHESINGLYYWIVFAEQNILKPPTPDFIIEIINQITNRRLPNLKYNISMITNILKRYPIFLSSDQMDSLCLALEYLLIETEIKSPLHPNQLSLQPTVVIPMSQIPEYRQKSASLAFALFNYYNQNQMAIPDVIIKWKEIGMTDLLPEVRHEWKAA